MALTLSIRFVGLCTLVQRGEITHVVIPSTAGHQHTSSVPASGGQHQAVAMPAAGRKQYAAATAAAGRKQHAAATPAAGGHEHAATVSAADEEHGPAVPGAGDHDDREAVPQHVAMLFLGSADLIAGQPLPAGISLTRSILKISDTRRARGAPLLPSALLTLDTIGGGHIAAEVLSDTPSAGRVNARIDLDLHGNVQSFQPGKYEFPGLQAEEAKVVIMDTYSQWTEVLDETDLRIDLVLLDSGAEPRVVNIVPPRDALGNVTLHIYHVPAKELPPNPLPPERPGEPIEHFEAYYQLFENVTKPVIPRLVEVAIDGAPESGRTRTCPSVIAL